MQIRIVLRVGDKQMDSDIEKVCYFGDDLSVEQNRDESGNIIKTLNGKLIFFDKAFDLITADTTLNAPKCYCDIYLADKLAFLGVFDWTKCEINYDDKILTATIEDNANKQMDFNAIINEEINVLSLNPETRKVKIFHPAQIQIALRIGVNNSRHLASWFNGQWYNSELDFSGGSDMTQFGFATNNYSNTRFKVRWSDFSNSDYTYSDGVSNIADGKGHSIRFSTQTQTSATGVIKTTITAYYYRGTAVARTITKTYTSSAATTWEAHSADFSVYRLQAENSVVYARVCSRTKRTSAHVAKKTGDPDTESKFYYTLPLNISGLTTTGFIRMSTKKGSTATDTSVKIGDAYYYPPDDEKKWIPFAQDLWHSNISYWINSIHNMNTYYNTYSNADACDVDSYKFTDVISSVLAKKNLSLQVDNQYQADSNYPLYIIPSSNVTRYPYSRPQADLTLTLQSMLDTYCTINNSEYKVVGTKVMIRSRYKTITQQEDTLDIRDKMWAVVPAATGQNIIKVDKLPSASKTISYQCSDGGPLFGAKTIINNDAIKEDSSENITLPCDADICGALIYPNRFVTDNKNYFVAVINTEGKNLGSVNATLIPSGQGVNNFLLSVESLLYNVYFRFLGFENFNMRGTYVDYSGKGWQTEKVKKITYNIPIGDIDVIDFNKLVNTPLGRGIITKLSINLTSLLAQIDLKI